MNNKIIIENENDFIDLIDQKNENTYISFDLSASGDLIKLSNLNFKYPDDNEDDQSNFISNTVAEKIKALVLSEYGDGLSKIKFENCEFNYTIKKLREKNFDLLFSNCRFYSDLFVSDSNHSVNFYNKCIFNNEVCFSSTKSKITFNDCKFNSTLDAYDAEFQNKVRFTNCYFKARVNFYNTTFNELVDFYGTIFSKKTIFNKTDFNSTLVFSSATFNKNVLFTYSTFKKVGIFNQTIFDNGLDLSQAIIEGSLTFFETTLENFGSEKIQPKKYYAAINIDGIIPHQNKRETFKIIKHQLIQQNNPIEAEKYLKLEKETLLREKELEAIFEDNDLKKIKLLLSDYLILKLNKYSNYFKTSWNVGLIFTLGVAFIFHSILSISECYLFSDALNYIRLINLTDFSLLDKCGSKRFYVIFFLAKLSIGYGIYQLIQAFRKFR